MFDRLLGSAEMIVQPQLRAILIGLLWLLIVAGFAIAAEKPVPVMAGKVANLDACPALGAIGGLGPFSDGFVAVRTGPGTHYMRLEELATGRHVYICEDKEGWRGIVYAADPTQDCGVSSPWPGPAPYRGPCKSGWVSSRFLKDIAG